MLKIEDMKLLAAPFDEKTLGIKVQSLSKNRDKAMLVAYLQHTDVAARLDQVDPGWTGAITRKEKHAEWFSVDYAITLLGVSRENVGEGDTPKAAVSDAFKRAAMLFGVGRYLYDGATVWVPYNETTDKFKIFTYADYKRALRQGEEGVAVGPASGAAAPGAAPAATGPKIAPKGSEAPKSLTRMELGTEIAKVAKAKGIILNSPEMQEWVSGRYGKAFTALTIGEMDDFLEALRNEPAQKGARA